MELEILPSDKIDKQKWDDCLNGSTSPFIYASSVYLDHMADNWEGIIGDDYSIIMPVPWRKKFGIKYCYDVPFVQQLGVFGKTLQQNDINACLKLMLQSFRYGDYSLNYMNDIKSGKACNNYMLSLASNYSSTYSFYSDKLKSDLSKAAKNSLEYKETNAGDVISFFKELYMEKIPAITPENYKNFYDLCALKEKENNLVARKISFNQKDIAMSLLLRDKYRLYNLISCTSPEGRAIKLFY